MSLMPRVNATETSVNMVSQFGGLNHNTSIPESDLYDMKNMTVDSYPQASTRAKRGLLHFNSEYEVLGVAGKDKAFVVYSKEVEKSAQVKTGVSAADLPKGLYQSGGLNYTQIPVDLAFADALKLTETKSETLYGTVKSPRLAKTVKVKSDGSVAAFNVSTIKDSSILVKYPHGDLSYGGDVYTCIGQAFSGGNNGLNTGSSVKKLYINANKRETSTANLVTGKTLYLGDKDGKISTYLSYCNKAQIENGNYYVETTYKDNRTELQNEYSRLEASGKTITPSQGYWQETLGGATNTAYIVKNTPKGEYRGGQFIVSSSVPYSGYNKNGMYGSNVPASTGVYFTPEYVNSTSCPNLTTTFPNSEYPNGSTIYLPIAYTTEDYFTYTHGTIPTIPTGVALSLVLAGAKSGQSYVCMDSLSTSTIRGSKKGECNTTYAQILKGRKISYAQHGTYYGGSYGTRVGSFTVDNVYNIDGTLFVTTNDKLNLSELYQTNSRYYTTYYLNVGKMVRTLDAGKTLNEYIADNLVTTPVYTYSSAKFLTADLSVGFSETNLKNNPYIYVKIGSLDNDTYPARTDDDLYTKVTLKKLSADIPLESFDDTDQDGFHISMTSADRNSEGEVQTEYIWVDKPHGAIPTNYTLKSLVKSKLFFAEYDVNTETISHETELGDNINEGHKNIVEMGANIVIFPEKIKVNTLKTDGATDYKYTEWEMLEKTDSPSKAHYRVVTHDGTVISSIQWSKPTNPTDNMYWCDTTEKTPVLKKYSTSLATWATVQPYVQICGLTKLWEEGDAVSITFPTTWTGIVPVENQKYFLVYKAGYSDEKVSSSYSYTIGNYITIPVAIKTAISGLNASGLTVTKSIPDMDYVIECNNRLWGCKYGLNKDGEIINEIFASKLGDPSNWHYFQNTSMDSYYVSLGDDGKFTGAVTYQSNPIFFRNDRIHRIYGNYPSNYQLKTVVGSGVADGSADSAIVMNDVVYYMAANGVFAYTGGTPTKVSEQFGDWKFHDASSGTLGHNLWMSMYDAKNNPVLMVYNDYYGMWHKHDDLPIRWYVYYDNEVYGITSGSEMWSLSGSKGVLEDDLNFMFQSGNIGYQSPFRKYLNKITLRLQMSLKTRCAIYMQYDSSGDWIKVAELRPTGKIGSVVVPVVPRRCDHFAIKMEGKGEIKLLGLTKYYEEGNDYD